MPPPVVGFTRPAASPTASSLGPYVRGSVESGRNRRLGSVTSSETMPQDGPTRFTNWRKKTDASPSHIKPTRTKQPEARVTGTAHANPPGAVSLPKKTSTSPPRSAGTSSCAEFSDTAGIPRPKRRCKP
jgi:hypothetical protein